MTPKITFSGETFTIDGQPEITIKKAGTQYRLPECTIIHLTDNPKDLKNYKADVIIFKKEQTKTIQKLKPKLAIIMDTLYEARKTQKETGIQTIAAQTIDLTDYAALPEQKTLTKFTTKK